MGAPRKKEPDERSADRAPGHARTSPLRGTAPEPHPSAGDPFDAGPFAELNSALHLQPRRPDAAAWRRAWCFAAVAWLPLLLLSSLQGVAWGADLRSSFLGDASAHIRYLFVIPLLVVAEWWCLPRLAAVAREFARTGLVGEADQGRLHDLMESARRQLDHRGAEVGLAVAAYAVTIGLRGTAFAFGTRTWISPDGGEGAFALTPAGWWCVLVSQPLFLLMWGVWLWRVAVWTRFLWGVSRLDLRLVPAHPDLAGGLRFAADSIPAFSMVGLALGASAAGAIMEGQISGKPLAQSSQVLAAAIAVLAPICLFAGPLLVFSRPLRKARLRGMREYGALAHSLGRRFEERWIRGNLRVDPEALSAPDFSATTDLYSIVANVRDVGVAPFGLRNLVTLVVMTLSPFLIVVLMSVPLEEVIKGIARLFL